MPGPSRADRVLPRRIGSFPGRAMVLHIGEGRPRGSIRGFPRDSGVLARMSVFSARAPMCRAGPSAHGRISAALSARAFRHDYADPPPAGPGRMCSTARHRPDTAYPGPTAPPRHRGSAPATHPPSRTIARFPAARGIFPGGKTHCATSGWEGRRAGELEVRASHLFEPPDRPSPVRARGGANGAESGISCGNPPDRGGRRAQ